jgi:hypothetical protein
MAQKWLCDGRLKKSHKKKKFHLPSRFWDGAIRLEKSVQPWRGELPTASCGAKAGAA